MTIFDKKPQISRREFKDVLRKAQGKERLSTPQKVRLEKEVFGRSYGEFISRPDFQRAVNDLKKQRFQVRDFQEKLRIDKRIKFLEELEKKPKE